MLVFKGNQTRFRGKKQSYTSSHCHGPDFFFWLCLPKNHQTKEKVQTHKMVESRKGLDGLDVGSYQDFDFNFDRFLVRVDSSYVSPFNVKTKECGPNKQGPAMQDHLSLFITLLKISNCKSLWTLN